MHEEQQTVEARDVMPPAQRYGIVVTITRTFNRQLPKPGHIFFVAKFNTKKHGIQEVFQVSFEHIKEHGEETCKEAVIQQVVAKYFTEVKK